MAFTLECNLTFLRVYDIAQAALTIRLRESVRAVPLEVNLTPLRDYGIAQYW